MGKFDKLGSLPISRRSPEDSLKNDVADILNWLRNGKEESLDPYGAFSKIDQLLPMKKGKSRQDRARDIGKALTWIRDPNSPLVAEDGIDSDRTTVASLPFTPTTNDENSTEIDNISTWMRNNKDPIDDTPDGKFQEIDNLLPTTIGETPLERAKKIDNAISWIRQDMPSDDDNLNDASEKIREGITKLKQKTPEDREKDV